MLATAHHQCVTKGHNECVLFRCNKVNVNEQQHMMYHCCWFSVRLSPIAPALHLPVIIHGPSVMTCHYSGGDSFSISSRSDAEERSPESQDETQYSSQAASIVEA